MKRFSGLRSLVVTVSLLGASAPSLVLAAGAAAPRPAAASSNSHRMQQLAADVREFASAPGFSRAKREKRIATAVRTAVVAATAYRKEPADVLAAATGLAAAATRAAPAFADVIANAAALAPGVARVEGAASSIRAAALAATRGGSNRRPVARAGTIAASSAKVRHAAPAPAPRAELEANDEGAEPAPAGRRVRRQPAPAPDAMESESDFANEPEVAPNRRGRSLPDQRLAVTLTTNLSARHDDNVFLAAEKEVSDTILSATPGLALRWGADAQTYGSLRFQEAFNRYVDHTAPNVSLAQGALDFAYQGAVTTARLAGNYDQLYQSSADTRAAGQSALIRSNTSGANASLEATPWAKLGLRVGGTYSKVEYKNNSLVGNRQYGVPIDLLFRATAKSNLSLGYVYGTQKVDLGDNSSKDHYFNLGASGEFTAKLRGSFNVGYQTRRVGENPSEHMLAFNGGFNYELTPKMGLTLSGTRSFNASAVGASTKNTAFRLGIESELTPQWRWSAGLAYLDNQYGKISLSDDKAALLERTDHLWEGNLATTYQFNEWFSSSLGYALRRNQSTYSLVEFSSNIFSLTLGLKY